MEWLRLEGKGQVEIVMVNPKHITHFEVYHPESDREIRVAIYLANQKSIIVKGDPHASYILWYLTTPRWKRMIYAFHNWYMKYLEELKELCLSILRKLKIKRTM